MDNNSFTVWANTLVPMTATQGDPESISASIVLIDPNGDTITHTAEYEELESGTFADLTYTSPDVSIETVYDYYVTENFESEPSLVYPDPDNCNGGSCELPTMTVCPLGGEVS